MRIRLALMVGVAAALATPGIADEAPLMDLDWDKPVEFARIKAVYPPAAFQASKSGAVELECRALAGGALQDCIVAKEEPSGQGFGDAALKLTPDLRLQARTLSGQSVAGRRVRFPVDFEPVDSLPDWLRKPSQNDLLAVYPPEAMRRGRSGKGTIACEVTVQGRLRDCRVQSESPPGEGFGTAALALAPQFIMKPAMKDGQPVAGGAVRIPITFMTYGGGDIGTKNRLIANIAWAEGPSVQQVLAAYPEKARAAKVGGTVVLDCVFASDGRVRKCDPNQENPRGYGFGKAAKDLAPLFRARDLEVGGSSIYGAHVHIPVTFAAAMLTTKEPPIGRPRWAALPTAEEALGGYPAEAYKAGTPGRVVLSCRVALGGNMEACEVVSEEPAGQGFGQAGLALSKTFRLTAWSDEGLPTVGGRIQIPVRYRPDAGAQPSAAGQPSSAPAP